MSLAIHSNLVEKSLIDNENICLTNSISSQDDIHLIEDFDNFLRIYHRMSDKEISNVKKELSQAVRFISVKVILDSAIISSSNEEVIQSFKEMIEEYIILLCKDLEYCKNRAVKQAKLYSKIYTENIKTLLNDNPQFL